MALDKEIILERLKAGLTYDELLEGVTIGKLLEVIAEITLGIGALEDRITSLENKLITYGS